MRVLYSNYIIFWKKNYHRDWTFRNSKADFTKAFQELRTAYKRTYLSATSLNFLLSIICMHWYDDSYTFNKAPFARGNIPKFFSVIWTPTSYLTHRNSCILFVYQFTFITNCFIFKSLQFKGVNTLIKDAFVIPFSIVIS